MPEAAFLAFEFFWYAAFAATLLHSLRFQGKHATAVFFVPAVLWGFLLEYATQEVFTRYHYGSGFLIYILNVPLAIALAWAALLYFGHTAAKRTVKAGKWWKLALASALPLVAIDFLLLEPLAKVFGFWTWTPESVWFGAPIGNFYAWFWVAAIYTTAFGWMESRKLEWKKKLAANTALVLPSVLVLLALLKVWKALFGSL